MDACFRVVAHPALENGGTKSGFGGLIELDADPDTSAASRLRVRYFAFESNYKRITDDGWNIDGYAPSGELGRRGVL